MTRTTHHFPELGIVHLNSLRLHEHVDAARIQPIAAALAEQGVLKIPSAVLPLDDGGGEYVALDGTNRTQALRSLGLSYTLVQVLRSVRAEITLGTWVQVIEGYSPDNLASEVRRTSGLRLTSWTEECEIEDSPPVSRLAMLSLQSGTQWGVESEEKFRRAYSRTEFADQSLRSRGENRARQRDRHRGPGNPLP